MRLCLKRNFANAVQPIVASVFINLSFVIDSFYMPTTFSTSDLSIASYAIATGAKLLRIDRSNRRAVFVLECEVSEADMVYRYMNEPLLAKDFALAQTHLKHQLFSNSL
jgi:hypothetical protein